MLRPGRPQTASEARADAMVASIFVDPCSSCHTRTATPVHAPGRATARSCARRAAICWWHPTKRRTANLEGAFRPHAGRQIAKGISGLASSSGLYRGHEAVLLRAACRDQVRQEGPSAVAEARFRAWPTRSDPRERDLAATEARIMAALSARGAGNPTTRSCGVDLTCKPLRLANGWLSSRQRGSARLD
jgi:hypothetical protein